MRTNLLSLFSILFFSLLIISCGEDDEQPIEVTPISGCTDSTALNYNSLATVDDGSCMFEVEEVLGCTDENATNYNELATAEDGSCEFAGDAFIGNYFGTLACGGLVDLISTDSLSFDIAYGELGAGETVLITLNNVGVSFEGTVSGDVITIDTIVEGLEIPDPAITVDLIVSGMPVLNDDIVSGDLQISVFIAGTIDVSDPLATEICAMSGTRQ